MDTPRAPIAAPSKSKSTDQEFILEQMIAGFMKRDGRAFDHQMLDKIRLMARGLVHEGEAPANVVAPSGFTRTTIYNGSTRQPRSCIKPFKNVEGYQSMYDPQKIEDAVLALLGAFEFDNGRAWKRIDFSVMEALAEKGYISNPHGRSESVYLSADGLARAKQLAERMFSE